MVVVEYDKKWPDNFLKLKTEFLQPIINFLKKNIEFLKLSLLRWAEKEQKLTCTKTSIMCKKCIILSLLFA